MANGRLAVRPDAPEYPGYVYWFHSPRKPDGADGDGARAEPSARGELDPINARVSDRVKQLLTFFVDAKIANFPYFAGDAFTAATS